ncbi:uncharacterized protein F4822DRAFT_44097 [Hypoxylon trugodes]|uniref:uncharacterized protein n=1 Tax=Hypoxylon trugodes TaxID=326681 RepID=UPI00219FC495|nr:uncharacterized protein F4822DRAFT_44097 [Hypoxylon trugodes]KAI1394284.1 hypothetical protein F4822DRAFT_44097 [Hypoxylon trugodes]
MEVLASLAGIITAGASLSQAVFDMVFTVRNAPKEMSNIAKGISELSIILEELRQIIEDGRERYSRRLIRVLKSTMKRISKVHAEIGEVLKERIGAAAQLKWIWMRSKATQLLSEIESHKIGIMLMLTVMKLAAEKKQSNRSELRRRYEDHARDQETQDRLARARQQTENVVRASYNSLRELATPGTDSDSGSEDEARQQHSSSRSTEIELQAEQSNDLGLWLYGLVFSKAADAYNETPPGSVQYQQDLNTPLSPEPVTNSPTHSTHSALIPHQFTVSQCFQALAQQPLPPSFVVNELLSEWTTLTEDEIEGTSANGTSNDETSKERKHYTEGEMEVQMISFKDCVGRKFDLPFHLARTWQSMTELIKSAFLHVDVVGPHVQAGHYDLIGPEGKIILPQVWKYVIQPNIAISMQMWPMDRPHQLSPGSLPHTVKRNDKNASNKNVRTAFYYKALNLPGMS